MSLHAVGEILSLSEPFLLAATLFAFARSKGFRGFPAFGAYLVCRLAVCVALLAILYSVHFSLVERHLAYRFYFPVYWVGYLMEAGLELLLIQEIFKHLVRPVPGLGRYGSMAFRWVTWASVVVALAVAIYPLGPNRSLLLAATSGLMRCMSILELCLLAFIVAAMQTLRSSPLNRAFGIALGLGISAAAYLFGSAFAFRQPSMASMASVGLEIADTLGAILWIVYFLGPAKEEDAVSVAISSPLRRWNEIATALAETAPPITLAPSSHFFLDDVEKAVDRVLEKNSFHSAG